ncbi:MAG: hypothetical protein ACRD4E_08185, partial [Bryobacteraceae bacterium]
MNRFRSVGIVTAIGAFLAGCSKTPDPSAVTGSTPASDAAPAKVEPPALPKPEFVTIAAGTPIRIRTLTTLSTKDAQTGERFTATLAEPIVIEGKVISPRGTQVEGRVVDSDPGGRVKGVATISLRLTQLRVGDHNVAIETRAVARQARATKRK